MIFNFTSNHFKKIDNFRVSIEESYDESDAGSRKEDDIGLLSIIPHGLSTWYNIPCRINYKHLHNEIFFTHDGKEITFSVLYLDRNKTEILSDLLKKSLREKGYFLLSNGSEILIKSLN